MATNPKVRKGTFEWNVISSYTHREGKEYAADDVSYSHWGERAGRGATAQQASMSEGQKDANLALPYIGQFLYMDVGCWTGDGGESGHERHREFGVVCGKVAALCSFTGERKKRELDYVNKKHETDLTSSTVFKERIEPFLRFLADKHPEKMKGRGLKPPANLPELGHILVLGALEVADPHLATSKGTPVDDQTLYVFLGDLHLPVIRDKKKTFIGNTGERDWVWRAGRYLGDASRTKVDPAVSGTPGVEEFGTPGLTFDPVKARTLDGWYDNGRTDGELMSRGEAGAWADCYIGENGNKGADIFQKAHGDLLEFLARLDEWVRPKPNDANPKRKLHLVQTGDLLDFWIGLKLGFRKNASLNKGAEGFVKFWYEETAKAQGSGQVLEGEAAPDQGWGRAGGARGIGGRVPKREDAEGARQVEGGEERPRQPGERPRGGGEDQGGGGEGEDPGSGE